MVLLLLELIRKKKLSEDTEFKITAIGMLLLLTIAVFVTANDIGRLF